MKKTHAYIIAILLCCQALHAGGGSFLQRLHPGVEWGFSPSLANYHHYNYLDESIGYRINDEGWTYPYHLNAFILAGVTVDLSSRLDLSVLSGYQGVDINRRTVPLLWRASYFFCGKDRDGFLLFGDAGVFLRKRQKYGRQLEAGAGYLISLTPHSSITFRIGGRVVYDRPDVWDPIEEEYISTRNIKRNDAWYYALNLGIGLFF